MNSTALIIIYRVIAVLNLPNSMNNFIGKAKAIQNALKNNSLFSALMPKITLLGTEIDTLDKTETGFKTKPPYKTRAERDADKAIVKKRLIELCREVQAIADADPVNAETIVKAADMDVKQKANHQKQGNTAKNGSLPGTVILTGQGRGPHNWRMSTDEINWILLPASKGSKTRVSGLHSLEAYYFQNCQVLTNGETGDWSQSVKIVVL